MDRRNNCDYSPTLREQPGAGRIVFDKVPHSPAGVITGGVFCDASSASQLGLCQVVRGEQIVISAICWIDALRCLDPLTETVDKRSAVKVHLVRSAPLEKVHHSGRAAVIIGVCGDRVSHRRKMGVVEKFLEVVDHRCPPSRSSFDGTKHERE